MEDEYATSLRRETDEEVLRDKARPCSLCGKAMGRSEQKVHPKCGKKERDVLRPKAVSLLKAGKTRSEVLELLHSEALPVVIPFVTRARIREWDAAYRSAEERARAKEARKGGMAELADGWLPEWVTVPGDTTEEESHEKSQQN